MTKHDQLLIAIGDFLEYRSGERGARAFVREPIYNVATSFREYLESLPDSESKTRFLKQYADYFEPEEKKLKAQYYTA